MKKKIIIGLLVVILLVVAFFTFVVAAIKIAIGAAVLGVVALAILIIWGVWKVSED